MKFSIPSVSVNAIEAGLAGAAGAAFAQATDPSNDGASAATALTYGFAAVGLYVGFKGAVKAGESLRSLCRRTPAVPAQQPEQTERPDSPRPHRD